VPELAAESDPEPSESEPDPAAEAGEDLDERRELDQGVEHPERDHDQGARDGAGDPARGQELRALVDVAGAEASARRRRRRRPSAAAAEEEVWEQPERGAARDDVRDRERDHAGDDRDVDEDTGEDGVHGRLAAREG
jgi:hypothetical protein